VARLQGSFKEKLEGRAEVIEGRARLTGPTTVRVGERTLNTR
jgi:pyruvate/2-oxoglutarate dehydrogenase complex dihydrolipoamide dehydrogenase (E3) component